MATTNPKWEHTGIPPCLPTTKVPTPTPMIYQYFFTTKHYKWLLKYQQLFRFYLVQGHSNVTRGNADNSLAEWESYQRSKMGAVYKYNPKWKHFLNGIGFCRSPPPTPNQVFDNHMASYNALRGTRNAIIPKKADNKALHGWWEYWKQYGKFFLLGESNKIKDQDWHTLFVLYSAGIFSGISFQIQNGLPSIMCKLSTIKGLPDSFHFATAKDPINYEATDGVPESIQVATSKEVSSEEV
jgi:hypothetical protein